MIDDDDGSGNDMIMGESSIDNDTMMVMINNQFKISFYSWSKVAFVFKPQIQQNSRAYGKFLYRYNNLKSGLLVIS